MRSTTNGKLRAGVLGATGLVGQRLVHLLAAHPWFELTEVAASERSSGKSYGEAVRWHLDVPIPAAARNLVVKGLAPDLSCDFVFSALDSSVAGPAEEEFARAGYPVVSNSMRLQCKSGIAATKRVSLSPIRIARRRGSSWCSSRSPMPSVSRRFSL